MADPATFLASNSVPWTSSENSLFINMSEFVLLPHEFEFFSKTTKFPFNQHLFSFPPPPPLSFCHFTLFHSLIHLSTSLEILSRPFFLLFSVPCSSPRHSLSPSLLFFFFFFFSSGHTSLSVSGLGRIEKREFSLRPTSRFLPIW